MTDEADTSAEAAIHLDADLSPAAADEVRVRILETLKTAAGGETAVPVVVDKVDISSTALQLLVSLTRTAERDKVALDLSSNAQAVLANVEHA